MRSRVKFPGAMTARQFNEAAKRANVSPMMLGRARRVLVDGARVQDVAGFEGVGTAAVYEAIHKVYTPPDPLAWPLAESAAAPAAAERSNGHTHL